MKDRAIEVLMIVVSWDSEDRSSKGFGSAKRTTSLEKIEDNLCEFTDNTDYFVMPT